MIAVLMYVYSANLRKFSNSLLLLLLLLPTLPLELQVINIVYESAPPTGELFTSLGLCSLLASYEVNLVAQAAADDDVPTAGYLQDEQKKLTLDLDAYIGVGDALIARLDKKSTSVKLKTLRLIKMLCKSGAPSFRCAMIRCIKEVRECLHWQGDPHPLLGDLPNKMVQEAAQQVLNPS